MILVALLGFCTIINFIWSKPPINELAWGFIPDIPKGITFNAVIGSIIMP